MSWVMAVFGGVDRGLRRIWGVRLLCLSCLLLLAVGWSGPSRVWGASPDEADDIIEHDLQYWGQFSITGPITPNKKGLGYFEVMPRVSLLGPDQPGPVMVLLIRPAIGYQLTQRFSLWQGYAWVPSFDPGNTVQENRLFQQALFQQHAKQWDVTNRFRLEERFIQGAGGTSVRARYLLRGVHPVGHSKKWFWALSNELFINLNSTPQGPQSGFDQNRAFVGIQRKLNESTYIEGGYMADYINYRHQNDRLLHIILLVLNIKVN